MQRIPIKALRERFVPLHGLAAAQQTGHEKTDEPPEKKSCDDNQKHLEGLLSPFIFFSGF